MIAAMKSGPSTLKRTYNLSAGTIEEVQRIAVELRVPQDSVVTEAVREFARMRRDARDSIAWAAAALDPEFQREMAAIATEFAEDDLTAWNR